MSKASTKSKTSQKKLRKLIPVEEAIARWRRDPAYVREYDALEEEFALVYAVDANAQALRRGDRPQAQDPLRTFECLTPPHASPCRNLHICAARRHARRATAALPAFARRRIAVWYFTENRLTAR